MNKIVSSFNHRSKSRNKKAHFLLTTTTNSNLLTERKMSKKEKAILDLKKNLAIKTPANKNKKINYRNVLKKLLIGLENNSDYKAIGDRAFMFRWVPRNKEKIPTVKTQEQLNNYLIQDFKDKVPPKIEISKSIKNNKIFEDFERYKNLLKEKNYINNIYLINEYKKKEGIKVDKSAYSFLNSPHMAAFKRTAKKKYTWYKPNAIFSNFLNIYKAKFQSEEKNYPNIFNTNTYTKNYEKRQSVHCPNNVYEYTSPEKGKSTVYSHLNSVINLRNNLDWRLLSKSERIYNEQKRVYSKYLKNVKKLRAKNFVAQTIKFEAEKNKIEKEKEKNKLTEWNEPKTIRTILDEDGLLLEIKRRNIFLDSFGIAGKNINSKDDDVDEDNFKGIKTYHVNFGMGATYLTTKMKIDPKYILTLFTNKTIDQYKANSGIYFGPKKIIEKMKWI